MVDRIINCADYSLHKEKRASCCDGPGVTSSSGTALQLPLARSTFILDRKALCHLFPSSCHEPAAVWGAMGAALLYILQSHCFLGRQNSRFSHLLPLSPYSCACLHHTVLYDPMSTTIHNSSFDRMHHPLTQRKTETWQKY